MANRTKNAKGLKHLAGIAVHFDLGANLSPWYQVLLGHGVEKKSSAHGVCSEEEVVAVKERPCNFGVQEVTFKGAEVACWIRLECKPLRKVHLRGGHFVRA